MKKLAAILTTLTILCVWTPSAPAHDDEHHRLDSSGVKLKAPAAKPDKKKFVYKTKGQLSIHGPYPDPTVEASYLVIRGTGSNAGSSGVIPLDAARWSGIRGGESGWKYKGEHRLLSYGGIKKIMVKSGKVGGSMKVMAKGKWFPFDLVGPQDSLELSLVIGAETWCANYDAADLLSNEAGKLKGKASAKPADCPAVCGNKLLEIGEQCDDGNADNSDTCDTACIGCAASEVEYNNTYEAIQALVFDAYDCSNDLCHGATGASLGNLDLRASAGAAALVNVPSATNPGVSLVFPGDQDLSMLYNKIAAKTLSPNGPVVGGSPMPSNAMTVTAEHLEALRLWIRGGASDDGIVEGTAELLGSCLPPPTPNKVPQPPVPDPADGFQVAQPGYFLAAQSETEGCIASYYDFSAPGLVPAASLVDCPNFATGTNGHGTNAGKCLAWSGQTLYQDAQSHHSIVHIYGGDYDWDDAGWGTWSCFGGDNDTLACDPTTADPCPGGGVCGAPFHEGVACLARDGFGPPDYGLFNNNAPTWSGSQESVSTVDFPSGVFSTLPLKGVVIWNSHAFNLTNDDMNLESWINVDYASTQTWPAAGLFNDTYIFTQEVPPFETREYCATHTFEENTHMFKLGSHMHSRGVRFRYYAPPQTPCGSGPDAPNGTGTDPNCLPGSPADIMYESFDYQDALEINYDPPLVFSGSVQDRTVKFCGLFDNGGIDESLLKTIENSPDAPQSAFQGFIPGGPCDAADAFCVGGPNKGQACLGDDNNCPNSVCDACTLLGGVTTGDEMFIATGNFYLP
ncbi:MAG: hypothetical protein H8E45_04745 [Proteobacteria bacterium]|nr:hypothetical protein [Pseudomonadota bacterium]